MTWTPYWLAKRELFDWPGLRAAVVNLDDPMGPILRDHVQARGLDVWTYGVAQAGRLQAVQVRYQGRALRSPW